MYSFNDKVRLNKYILNNLERSDYGKALTFKTVASLDNYKAKSAMLGYSIKELADNIISVSNTDDLMIISDKIITIQDEDAVSLFANRWFKIIDMQNIDSSKMKSAEKMFKGCHARKLNIDTLDTSHVLTMDYMFSLSFIDRIDLSKISTKNLESAKYMFNRCGAQYMNIENFKIKGVNTDKMFWGCNADIKLPK